MRNIPTGVRRAPKETGNQPRALPGYQGQSPWLVVGIALVIAITGCAQQPTGVAAAAEAMGATNLNTIEYSGSGSNFAFGQAASPGERWPRFEVKTYAAAVDYQTPAMRLDMLRAQGEHPPHGGGGQPFAGDQRTIQVVSGTHAWTEGGAQPARQPWRRQRPPASGVADASRRHQSGTRQRRHRQR